MDGIHVSLLLWLHTVRLLNGWYTCRLTFVAAYTVICGVICEQDPEETMTTAPLPLKQEERIFVQKFYGTIHS